MRNRAKSVPVKSLALSKFTKILWYQVVLQLPCALTYNFQDGSVFNIMGRKHTRLLMPIAKKMKANCLCGMIPQPDKPAGLTISLFVEASEAHLCYEKKIQTWLDSASCLCAFQSNKETEHHVELRSWEQTFLEDMWETSQGRLISISGKGFFLSAGSELWGWL